jgi:hypothetical protein
MVLTLGDAKRDRVYCETALLDYFRIADKPGVDRNGQQNRVFRYRTVAATNDYVFSSHWTTAASESGYLEGGMWR